VVIHICNLSHSGNTNQEDCGLRSAWAKISETLNKLGMVVHTCIPSYARSIHRRIMFQTGPRKNKLQKVGDKA
jgi:hypothetical protein